MPGSALDGGTYGCMSHVSDLWVLRHSPLGKTGLRQVQRRDTGPPEMGLVIAWSAEKIKA